MNNQKTPWKALVLEHLHNCFIGISQLTCSEEDCPLTENWDNIEEKLSKKGQAVFYQVSKKDSKFLVLDLQDNPVENDLGELENITIQFRSGKTQRVKPKETEKPNLQTSGYQAKEEVKEIFLNPAELVCFFNNPSHTPNLQGAEEIYLNDLWETKAKIKWDQEKSKKKVFLHVENDPSDQTQGNQIVASEKDYLFYVSDPSITNPIKKMEVYSPGTGTQERQQLWTDYREEFSEMKEFFGIRHNSQEKEERQNNPEIDMIKSSFLATERRKKRIREESLREAESKGFCEGTHTLSYGSLQEHQQEIFLEKEVRQEERSEQSEQKEEKPKEETKQIPLIKDNK